MSEPEIARGATLIPFLFFVYAARTRKHADEETSVRRFHGTIFGNRKVGICGNWILINTTLRGTALLFFGFIRRRILFCALGASYRLDAPVMSYCLTGP